MPAVPARSALPATAEAPALARRLLAESAAAWPAAVLQDALLLTSEMVTNAVRHGTAPIELRITIDADRLRVEVSDGEPRMPGLPRPFTPQDESHRGLFLIATLAGAWGSTANDGGAGKTVWFEVALPGH